uniref:Uncharacterized protein n=1 Tax=Chlamydomonas euryale TaxID=1486919 RepID=A0A7R9YRR2_9CHLO
MDYHGTSLVEPQDTLLYAADAKKAAHGRPMPEWCPLKPTSRFVNTLDAAIVHDSFQTHVRLNLAHEAQVVDEGNMVSAAKKIGDAVRSRAQVKQMVKAVMKQEKEWAHNPKDPPPVPVWKPEPEPEPDAQLRRHALAHTFNTPNFDNRHARLFRDADGPGLMGSKRKVLNVRERLERAASTARPTFGSGIGTLLTQQQLREQQLSEQQQQRGGCAGDGSDNGGGDLGAAVAAPRVRAVSARAHSAEPGVLRSRPASGPTTRVGSTWAGQPRHGAAPSGHLNLLVKLAGGSGGGGAAAAPAARTDGTGTLLRSFDVPGLGVLAPHIAGVVMRA